MSRQKSARKYRRRLWNVTAGYYSVRVTQARGLPSILKQREADIGQVETRRLSAVIVAFFIAFRITTRSATRAASSMQSFAKGHTARKPGAGNGRSIVGMGFAGTGIEPVLKA
jgi:hypothetical protein